MGAFINDLDMRPSLKNEGPTVVMMDKSSKSPLLDSQYNLILFSTTFV